MTKSVMMVALLLVLLGLSALTTAGDSGYGNIYRAWKEAQAQQEAIDRRLKAIEADADKSFRALEEEMSRDKGQKRPSSYGRN